MDACISVVLSIVSFIFVTVSLLYNCLFRRMNYPETNKDKDNLYPMDTNPSGLCIILNIDRFKGLTRRSGSEKDVKNLKSQFESLNFTVEILRNLTFKEINQSINDIRQREDLRDHSAFIFIAMSHGREGLMYSSDTVGIYYNEIYEPFNDENCVHLRNKPKIFFFQTCRTGMPSNDANESKQTSDVTKDSRLMNKDILLCFSTVNRYKSFRNKSHGSFYMNALCEALNECADSMDIFDIMRVADSKVDTMTNGDTSQTTNFKTMKFNKEFKFKLRKKLEE